MPNRKHTSAATYAEGYQDALKDIAQALADDGEEGVRTWLANNLVKESYDNCREGKAHVRARHT